MDNSHAVDEVEGRTQSSAPLHCPCKDDDCCMSHNGEVGDVASLRPGMVSVDEVQEEENDVATHSDIVPEGVSWVHYSLTRDLLPA
jgi:hypothetical protein